MAKTAVINRDLKRRAIVKKFTKKRAMLQAIIDNAKMSDEDRLGARLKLQKLPRDASPTRLVNRCAISGRRHGFIRKFGVSRLTFREAALNGLIPGVTKASW